MSRDTSISKRFAQATEWLAQGEVERAEPLFRAILGEHPADKASCNNLAACLFAMGRYADALPFFARLAGNAPEDAMAHYNAGLCLRKLGDPAQAIRAYRQALALRPDYRDARENLANLLADSGQQEEALALFQVGLDADPERSDNYRQAALLLRERGTVGDMDAAQATLDRAIGQGIPGSDALRLVRALLLPPIARSSGEIACWRNELRDTLASLERQPLSIADPLREVGVAPFFLAYHGEDDRDLNASLARVLRQACPALCFRNRKLPGVRRPRPRIGVVTAHAGQHTTARYFSASIRALTAHAEVRTYYVGQEWRGQYDAESLPAHGQLPEDLQASQQALADEALDILIYPEIGMHPQAWLLAHARLAPVQVALYGHPVTTGIPTVDYFLSHAGSEYLAAGGAAADYTEQLLLLPEDVSPACIAARRFEIPRRTRADFGLPEDGRLYLCAQALFKIHPDFDAVVAEVLRRDPAAEVLLFAACGHWGECVLARMRRAMPAAAERVRMLPFLPLPEFIALAACCDVALDTPQYSGGGTSYDCLQVGVPIITLPGRFMRARQTAALHRRLGSHELIAADQDDYLRLALRIANDPAAQREFRAGIIGAHDRLYDDRASADAFCALILGARAV